MVRLDLFLIRRWLINPRDREDGRTMRTRLLFVITLTSFLCFGQNLSAAQSSVGNITRGAAGGSSYFDVKAFCASGSQEQTTGAVSGTTLTLARAIDFANCPPDSGQTGQGIRIYHAGAAPTVAAPTRVTVTPVGITGSTTYSYEIVTNDYYGGASAPTTAATTTTGNATLSSTNFNNVCFTPSTDAASYTIYRTAGPAFVPITTFDSTPASLTYCFHDTGINTNGQSWGNSTTTLPDWLPSSTPSRAINDWCVNTIASGAGTTALTLAVSCPNAATAQIVKHDDTAAVQAATNACNTASGGTVRFPIPGNYNIGFINFPAFRYNRGWVIWDIQSQITITYPISFGNYRTPIQHSRIRITGGSGGAALSSQFPSSNSGHINSLMVSPVIHSIYNGGPIYPLVFDHIGIFNRGGGGGDGIVIDGGNSGGTYINNVDVAVTGTSLKVGYGGIVSDTNGPCTLGAGFGLYVDHSTFTSYFNGDPLTNCDGWGIDNGFGISYFDTITLVGTGVHVMGLGTTDWNHIYQESSTAPAFLTWDTSVPSNCTPECGVNTFRHLELADPATGVAVGITNTALTSNVATVTTANRFTVGETVVVAGTTNGSGVFNGKVITTAVSSTSFNFALTHANVTRAADTGTATPIALQYLIQTVKGGSTAMGKVDFDEVEAVSTSLVGGTTPMISCNINQNGPNISDFTPGLCNLSAGNIQGQFVSASYGNSMAITPNMYTGLQNLNALNIGIAGAPPGGGLGMQAPVGFTGNYLNLYTPSSVYGSSALALWIDSNYNIHAPGFINTQFTGTTSSIGGNSLSAGVCTTGAVSIPGAATTMAVAVSPAADPGTGFTWEGFVSAPNTVTVRLCNTTSSQLTPKSTTYNVRVIQ